ncbi:hypothetical protein SAMN05444166_3348 [Singulisphaera sp. GP187]|uniref:hypothetical protein n=1 Tax=Singulisphaera sp. GP187 TaxID=1882752 RepID=UPI00092BB6D9|nr:hypothetical protein [Singulisphaera sp. GP187]SIO26714.1 hypothetical protein SAMN05444166_3348 [Singulisphaera sp. GP187]
MLVHHKKAWFQVDKFSTYNAKTKELVNTNGFVCFVFFDVDEDPRAGSLATFECLGPIRTGSGGPPRVFATEQEAVNAGIDFMEQESGHH